jgi:hypothetical protein
MAKLSTYATATPVDGDYLLGTDDPGGTPSTKNFDVSNFDKTGKKTIWVPAAAMRPTVSNGCASVSATETTAGRPDIIGLDFDGTAATQEHAQFQVAMPKSWNLGTVTFQAFWTSKTNTGTETVKWDLQGVVASADDTIDVAYGTFVGPAADANTSAIEEMQVTAESGAVTISGTPADDDMAFFRIRRDPDSDTMTQDATLLGIKLFITTDTGNDA